MDGGSTNGSSVGSGREDPSAAIDKFFLELHDKLPKDARGKLAQLADEVKRLSDASISAPSAAQTTPPRTPPPSSVQEPAGSEEGTVEARQSSGELAKGEVLHTVR